MSWDNDYNTRPAKESLSDTLLKLWRSGPVKILFRTIMVLTGLIILYATRPWYTILPGYAAVHLRLGRVVRTPVNPGFYWKLPAIDDIIPLDMRIKKSVIKTEAFSHDLQVIDVEVAINYRIQDPLKVYQNIGAHYEQTVIDPFTQESLKAIIAMFTAEELTQQREKAKGIVKENLSTALQNVDIKLVDFNFIHVDFQQEFIHSVERKQIAQQRAKEAQFDTMRVKELAKQTKETADAQAYALKVQKEMATPQLAILKAIEKWDGKLPRIMTSGLATFVKGIE